MRGATAEVEAVIQKYRQISTHAPLAGRDVDPRRGLGLGVISTHAPLAGRDLKPYEYLRTNPISTHAPLAGRDFPLSILLPEP